MRKHRGNRCPIFTTELNSINPAFSENYTEILEIRVVLNITND